MLNFTKVRLTNCPFAAVVQSIRPIIHNKPCFAMISVFVMFYFVKIRQNVQGMK